MAASHQPQAQWNSKYLCDNVFNYWHRLCKPPLMLIFYLPALQTTAPSPQGTAVAGEAPSQESESPNMHLFWLETTQNV